MLRSRSLLGVLLCASVAVATAQTEDATTPESNSLSYGAQVNVADDFDLGIGGRVLFGTEQFFESTRVAVSFDLYFPEDGTSVDVSFWEINVNGHYLIPLEGSPFDLYSGAGLHYYRLSFDYDRPPGFFDPSFDDSGVGLNLLGGAEFDANGNFTPFAEVKFELGGAEQYMVTGGVRF